MCREVHLRRLVISLMVQYTVIYENKIQIIMKKWLDIEFEINIHSPDKWREPATVLSKHN